MKKSKKEWVNNCISITVLNYNIHFYNKGYYKANLTTNYNSTRSIFFFTALLTITHIT